MALLNNISLAIIPCAVTCFKVAIDHIYFARPALKMFPSSGVGKTTTSTPPITCK
jgi:hypothetical protein